MTLAMPDTDYDLETMFQEVITIPCEGCGAAAVWIEHMEFEVPGCQHFGCDSCRAKEDNYYARCVSARVRVKCLVHGTAGVVALPGLIRWEPL